MGSLKGYSFKKIICWQKSEISLFFSLFLFILTNYPRTCFLTCKYFLKIFFLTNVFLEKKRKHFNFHEKMCLLEKENFFSIPNSLLKNTFLT